jgi:hypothetical protein
MDACVSRVMFSRCGRQFVYDSIKWRGEVGQALQKHNADVIRVISYEVHSCHCSILVKRQGELGRFATF